MNELQQYHFDRADFVKVWEEVLGDKSLEVVDLCNEHTFTTSFELWCDESEEYYIEYLPTGVTINWYKGAHLGRTNTCTDPNFTLDEFKTFLTLLKDELIAEVD